MILIDTSAWIEFFRKQGNLQTKKMVASFLEKDQSAYSCPIQFELLAGAKTSEKSDIEEALFFSTHLPFLNKHWQTSAKLEQQFRKQGITVPRDDIFVTVIALEAKIPLLARDKHFEIITQVCPLQLV